MTSYNGQTITYDEIGNPLSYRDGMTMTWQNGRQLASLQKGNNDIQYSYDSEGIRVSKTINGEKCTFEYLNGMLLYETRGEKFFHYYYDSNGTLYAVDYKLSSTDTSTRVYYFTHNWRGDIVGIYNGNGDLRAKYEYDSWGNVISITDGNGNAITDQNHIANLNPFRYRGYYMDTETGMYYLMSRYYDPVTHRFLNADSEDVLSEKLNEFTNKNLFVYCDNNSNARADDEGDFWHILVGAVVGGVVNGVCSIVSQLATTGEINWGVVGVDALSGVCSGALASTGIGLSASVVLNTGISMATYSAEQFVQGKNITAEGLADSALTGVISGFIGGAGYGNNYLKSTSRQLNKRVSKAIAYSGTKCVAVRETKKAIVNYAKNSCNLIYNGCKKGVCYPAFFSYGKSLSFNLLMSPFLKQ